MKKKIISLLLAAISLLNLAPFSILPAVAEEGMAEAPSVQEETLETEEGYIKGLVTVACDESDTVTLARGDKLYAFTTLAPELGDGVTYKWEVKNKNGGWSIISGYVFPYAVISEAVLFCSTLEDGSARMRCVVTKEGKKFVSNELTVYLSADVNAPAETEVNEETEETEAELAEPVSLFSLRSAPMMAAEPEVTEPEVTEPEVAEPEVTEPEVAEPEVT